MTAIALTEQETNALADDVWEIGLQFHHVSQVYGLMRLDSLLEKAEIYLDGKRSGGLVSTLNDLKSEIDEWIGDIHERDTLEALNDGEPKLTLEEIADELEGWIEEIDFHPEKDAPDDEVEEIDEVVSDLRKSAIAAWECFKGAHFFDKELGEKYQPYAFPVGLNTNTFQFVFDQLSAITVADWADPNERCKAITIAWALLVSPSEVFTNKDFTAATHQDFGVEFRGLRMRFPRPAGVRDFAELPYLKLREGSRQISTTKLLPNLAVTYSDHLKNMEAKKFLDRYLPKASTDNDRAAVLGLAWATLQNRELKECYPRFVFDAQPVVTPIEFDMEIRTEDPDLWIRIKGGLIVQSHCP